MIITAIKQQERLKGRYSVYVDDKYAFSLSAEALLEAKVTRGQQLDAAQLKEYQKLSGDDKAYGLALAYVARRMRSQHELTDYFRRKGYDHALSNQILQKLTALGLVDDQKFAEAWIRNRRILKPTGRRKLAMELRQKHVAADVIDQALSRDEIGDQSVLQELISRKRKQLRYRDDLKLMRYLAGQGFSYDDIKHAIHADDQVADSI